MQALGNRERGPGKTHIYAEEYKRKLKIASNLLVSACLVSSILTPQFSKYNQQNATPSPGKYPLAKRRKKYRDWLNKRKKTKSFCESRLNGVAMRL
ncbi:hypothetical protein HYFRA_00009757 [Hymenoscyphus fraxineus]|uniref:Uncharacterized protein n=1 Tax=Hymenoscyphus fraxineus TaxID=746836 RepID=A0A9N9KRM8_9HELO|nr:hypothetical protein HYFRA_00009757 [Hymenoscyphus fraxineus]